MYFAILRCNKYPQNGNLYFCNGSCKLPRANCRSMMPLVRRNGRSSGALFEDLTSKQLAKLWLPPRAGSTFPKHEQNLAENCGLSNISGDGAAYDTRNAHPRRAISKKYTLFQWILQILRCNKYPKYRTFSVKVEAQKGLGSRFRMHATFKIMLPNEGGEHIFKKTTKNKEKRVQ